MNCELFQKLAPGIMARILECRGSLGFDDPRKEGHLGRECQDNPVDIQLHYALKKNSTLCLDQAKQI